MPKLVLRTRNRAATARTFRIEGRACVARTWEPTGDALLVLASDRAVQPGEEVELAAEVQGGDPRSLFWSVPWSEVRTFEILVFTCDGQPIMKRPGWAPTLPRLA